MIEHLQINKHYFMFSLLGIQDIIGIWRRIKYFDKTGICTMWNGLHGSANMSLESYFKKFQRSVKHKPEERLWYRHWKNWISIDDEVNIEWAKQSLGILPVWVLLIAENKITNYDDSKDENKYCLTEEEICRLCIFRLSSSSLKYTRAFGQLLLVIRWLLKLNKIPETSCPSVSLARILSHATASTNK